jgi:hypothetical protein
MSRQGIALLVAVVVLAALGIISATGIALGRAERTAGALAVAEVQARGAAEGAIAVALLGWPPERTPVGAGAELPVADLSVPGPAVGRAVVRALGGRVYSILGTGERVDRGGRVAARVRAELLITLDSLGPDSLARPRPYPRGWRLLP